MLKHFLDRRLFTVFCFGISSGLPWVMIGSVMSAWLKDEGLSRSAIGLFGLIFSVYSINFLWSPLVDRLRIPLLGGLGRRRSWIVAMQCIIVLLCLSISQFSLDKDLWLYAACGLAIAICSATQDIAIDAYRIDIIGEDKAAMSASSSMATAGWWTGYGGMGAIPFWLVGLPGQSWPLMHVWLAILMSGLVVITLCVKEPQWKPKLSEASQSVSAWLYDALIAPFANFFSRNGTRLALTILLFIFSFKIGEAFLGRMSIVFYKELGFSNADIGTYSKLINWWVTIAFSVIGGMFTIRFGVYKGLMIAGIAMASSNLMFAVMAQVGPSPAWFIAAVVIDGFTASWSTVAMVAFISLLCDRTFSATQYALMASLSVLGRTVVAGSSGMLVDWLDGNWTVFFIFTALMVIPALWLLSRLQRSVSVLS